VVNPQNPSETYESLVWPVHCVQHSPGAELIPELDVSRLDRVIEKGTHPKVEMYSAFYDPLKAPRVCDSGLAGTLKEAGVTDVYVVGLAADFCVKYTALDSQAEGFMTYVIEEGTRAVDTAGWADVRQEIERAGVKLVSVEGPEVRRLKGDV
jgi:nicotinamidase-related amidase